jgi:hypothetical protein
MKVEPVDLKPAENLNIDSKLPKIVMPKEKAKMFLDWYKNDLCNEDKFPVVFNEGYFSVDISEFIKIKTVSILELDSKSFQVQNELISELRKEYDNIILKFVVLSQESFSIEMYSEQTMRKLGQSKKITLERIKNIRETENLRKKLFSDMDIKDVDEDLMIDLPKLKRLYSGTEKNILEEFSIKVASLCQYLLISSFWYLASIKNTKEETLVKRADSIKEIKTNKHKNGINVRKLITPIYDFGCMKNTDVKKLVARKKGWKISCEFQVRGHYRHYKSGKVVFVKPFEKGKGLEAKNAVIKLMPKEG